MEFLLRRAKGILFNFYACCSFNCREMATNYQKMHLQRVYLNRKDLKKNLYWPVDIIESLRKVHKSLCTESNTMDRTNHSCVSANYFLDNFQS